MKYYLGIDSGGTKTKFTLIDEEGKVICHALSETTNYLQVGFERVAKNLREGVSDILESASIRKEDIAFTFIGLASYGEIQSDFNKIHETVEVGLSGLRYSIGNDNVCGWGGSLAGKPGINIVSGTGSIAYARNEDNEESRSGGWGYFCGGDEGSAYWIGCKLVNAFTRQCDDRLPKTKLYDYMMSNYHLQDNFEILDLIIHKWGNDRGKIAQLSKVAYELAKLNDPIAIQIFVDAAKELSEIILAAYKQLDWKKEVYVSYSGGVFLSKEYVLEPLKKYLPSNMILVEPLFSPSVGGAIVAMLEDHVAISSTILNNLKVTQS